MITLDTNLIADLKAVAEKHGMTYETLCQRIRDIYDGEDRMEYIRSTLVEVYPDIALTDENVEKIYNRFIRREDNDLGIWDNIQAAIDYLYEDGELELVKDEDKD